MLRLSAALLHKPGRSLSGPLGDGMDERRGARSVDSRGAESGITPRVRAVYRDAEDQDGPSRHGL